MYKPNRYSLIALSLLLLATAALPPTAHSQGIVDSLTPTQSSNSLKTSANRPQPIPVTTSGKAAFPLDPESNALFKNALEAEIDGDFRTSLADWTKLVKKYPSHIRFQLGRLQSLEQLKRHREIVSELEPLLKKMEAANERYAIFYFLLLDAYIGSGQFSNGKVLAERMVSLFAHRGDLLIKLQRRNIRLKDTKLAAQLSKTIHDLQVHNTNKAPLLLAVKPAATSVIASGKVFDIVVSTICFPRFRLRIAPDRLNGDSGVARYIIAPPNYQMVTLIDDDSKNYLPLTLDKLLEDHCGWPHASPAYSSVVKTGSTRIGGYDCDVYKCQIADETAYEVLYLSRGIKLEPALAQTISQLCFAPPLYCLPLKMETVGCGEVHNCIEVVKFGQSQFKPADMAVPAGFHRVKDMAELQLASEGALKESDIDEIFSTTKKTWKKQSK